MTRKDYEAIASRLKDYRKNTRALFPDYAEAKPHKLQAIDEIVEILSSVFATDNPRFDADKFRKATQ
jgi:hypothetical protein